MVVKAKQIVYAQRNWTDKALVASYRPVKRITMVRLLPLSKAPKSMRAAGNTIPAKTGYWIAYEADTVLSVTLDDYKPRPIEPEIFALGMSLSIN